MSKPFVNLHTHSFYSILEAPFSPADILQRAKELGHPKVALTDTGNVHGIIEFFQKSQKVDGVLPILGVEVAVSAESRLEKRFGIDGQEGSIVMLAQNETGLTHLLNLVTKAQLEGLYNQPRIDHELLTQNKEGLVFLTGSVHGYIGKFYTKVSQEKAEQELLRLCEGVEANRLYIEVVARPGEEQIEYNQWCVQMAQKHNLELVITSDARYATREDQEMAEVLYCIGSGHSLPALQMQSPLDKNWFKSWDEIAVEMSYLPAEALEKARANTIKIAELVELEIPMDQSLLPQFEVPESFNEASWLRECCLKAINGRYGYQEGVEISELGIKKSDVLERLDYELSVIGRMGFDAYFLIVADFIDFARAEGISVGPGRGSAAGSLVSYLLGITNIDPLFYELLFERFLNPERISMPDIDIDFSDERREEVMDYVVDKYGTDKVSKVCTFGTLAAKAALKDVGRALGVQFSDMNSLTKVLPNKPGFGLSDAEEIKEFMEILVTRPDLKRVFDLARKLEGCVRHVSVHACAVIIGKYDLSQNTALQWAPGTEDVKISQFPYQQLESIGLLKMDFLGLKNLSILEKAIANIQKNQGITIDLERIPLEDEKTFKMLSEGETTGVFQFESAGMRRYLRELKPTELEDLVAMNALYRPGPMEYIPQYIGGKHDPETVEYMHPTLEPILRKTYGIAVYQEQVLRIAQDFAGFSLGEADILRKAIGKKITEILPEQRTKFIEGAVKKGHDRGMATKIFDDIVVPFSGYGFNRSHAVCYARIAYETAYLRANYPVEFMAAMMTTDRNNTDRIVLEMNECVQMGIEVLPPSINESDSFFTVIKASSPADLQNPSPQPSPQGRGGDNDNQTECHPEKEALEGVSKEKETTGSLRFGLTAIKGLGEDTVEQIMVERNAKGRYQDLQDFAKRVPAKLMNKKTLEALAFSGAFDEFGDRKAIVESLDDLAKFAREYQEKDLSGQMGLFGAVSDAAISFVLRKAEATKEDILRWERDSLGLFVSDHPLKGLNQYFEKNGTPISELPEIEDKKKKPTFHGIVTSVRNIITRAGKNMMIFELEDTSGKIECAIFPQKYESINPKGVDIDAFLRIKAKIEERDGQFNAIVEELKVGNLKAIQEQFEPEVLVNTEKNEATSTKDAVFHLIIPHGTTKEVVDEVKKILLGNKSEVGETVHVTVQGKMVELPFKVAVSDALKQELKGLVG